MIDPQDLEAIQSDFASRYFVLRKTQVISALVALSSLLVVSGTVIYTTTKAIAEASVERAAQESQKRVSSEIETMLKSTRTAHDRGGDLLAELYRDVGRLESELESLRHFSRTIRSGQSIIEQSLTDYIERFEALEHRESKLLAQIIELERRMQLLGSGEKEGIDE